MSDTAIEAPEGTQSTETDAEPQAIGRRPLRLQVLSLGGKYGTVAVLVGMIIAFLIAAPTSFGSAANLLAVVTNLSPGAIVAFGLTICLIAGDLDLSIGYQASIAGVFVVGLISGYGILGTNGPLARHGWPIALSIVVVLAVGAVFGLVNGLIVTKLRVNALIATLGTGTVILAINLAYGQGATYSVRDGGSFVAIAQDKLFNIVPYPIIILVVFAAIGWLILNVTPIGQHMKAVGDDPEAARRVGINVSFVRIVAFVLAGVFATAGGVLLSASLGSGDSTAGDGYLLQAFAAVFLGSAALHDGEFHIVGTLIGALTVAIGVNGLAIFGAPSFAQYLFSGGLLIIAVALSALSRSHSSDL